MTELVIYGAGGMAREVAQLAVDLAAAGERIEVVGFLTDDAGKHGSTVGGLPVLGDYAFLAAKPKRYDVAIGIGAPHVRRRVAEKLAPLARGFPTLVHPSVLRSNRVALGRGVIIAQGASLTVDIHIGDFVIVNVAATLAHDAVIGDYATLAPGVHVSGHVVIGTGCDIGTGTAIVQEVRIDEWTIVGAGAVVSDHLPSNCTAVGVPARPIKQRPPGWHLTP